ncbi:MAG TPA: hypothetical protein ENK54_05760 [Thiotrichales bacterium]|nr:hypothetical protein [Thiotrichales bacterium]
MKLRWLPLCSALLASSVLAKPFQPILEVAEQFDDTRVVAFINENDIRDYPVWEDRDSAPPFSISDAIHSIEAAYRADHRRLDPAAIEEIELRKVRGHEKYWHYLVKVHDASRGVEHYAVYVVLMNGKVIPAVVEPEPFK